MATTRYYYSKTSTTYTLTNETRETLSNPSLVRRTAQYTSEDGNYGTQTLYSGTTLHLQDESSIGTSNSSYYVMGQGGNFVRNSNYKRSGNTFTIPAGSYIVTPSADFYYEYGDSFGYEWSQMGSDSYAIIPIPSKTFSTVSSEISSFKLRGATDLDGDGEDDVDAIYASAYANLIYYAVTDVVYNYSEYSDEYGTDIVMSYKSGTMAFVKGNVSSSSTTSYLVKTSNSYDSSYGGYAKGSYTLEPSSVSLTTTTPQAGKSATISVSRTSSTGSNASTYGYPITYTYQYSTNGGSSWTTIASSTATSYSFTVPSGVSSIMVRVQAKDSLGTGGYTTSGSYTIQQSKTYVGVSGVVRTASVKICQAGGYETLPLMLARMGLSGRRKCNISWPLYMLI